LNQINDQDDNCDDEQDVNESAHGVGADESEKPQHEQNNEDGPEHIVSFGLSFPSIVCGDANALMESDFDFPDF
jgi:hypothetical protein